MNGWIDPVGRTWTDSSGVAAPIALTEQGRYVCPLCAREHMDEALTKLPKVDRFYCGEGHQLHWGRPPFSEEARLLDLRGPRQLQG